MSQLVLETPHPVHVGGRPATLWRAQSAVMTAVAFGAMGPSPRIVDTVLVDYAAVGSVAARWAS